MNEKEKILVLGNKGMLGHVVERYLKETKKYEVKGISREEFDALTNEPEEIILKYGPSIVINCIGILNKSKNFEEMKKINSLLPHKLAKLAKKYDYKLIHISTDCVFNGKEGFPYSETSIPNPEDFYGITKASGEINDDKNLTIRTSIIGPEIREKGTGLFKWVKENEGGTINGFSKVIWSGVTTLELAKGIEYFIENKTTGIINFTFDKIDKRSLIILINEIYNLNIMVDNEVKTEKNMILESKRNEMNNYPKKSFKEMIMELKEWY